MTGFDCSPSLGDYHRCNECNRVWAYYSPLGACVQLIRAAIHVWWKHER